MDILVKPFGANYQTNCYILKFDDFEIVIDPGIESFNWIKQNCKNVVAILNTHGHFDHIWDNQKVKKFYNAKIYIPKDDAFMLENDIFNTGVTTSKPDILVKPDQKVVINGEEFVFYHFPGHTPGCSAIGYKNNLFSGDFIFKNSIGRVDFPYSNPKDMKKSLEKFLLFNKDVTIFPGHGDKTTFFNEKNSIKAWIKYL